MTAPDPGDRIRTIRDGWVQYADYRYGEDGNGYEFREARMAFYGGCAAMLELLLFAYGLSPDKSAKELVGLKAELEAFAARPQG